MPYEIINIKNSNYSNEINQIPTKLVFSDKEQVDTLYVKLKKVINESISEFENSYQKNLIDIKTKVKIEQEKIKKNLEKLKAYEK